MHRLVERQLRGRSQVLKGHHNTNYVLRVGVLLALLLGVMPFARLKYRVPLDSIPVVPRIWPREADVLEIVCRYLREVPRCVIDLGDRTVHRYHRGKALSEKYPHEPLDDDMMRWFAEFFVRTAHVPVTELPTPPEDWPDDGDSEGFLHWLIDFTEAQVHRPNQERFGLLFNAVGIREDAMAMFRKSHSGLTSRPFKLLHTDVHRANVVVRGKRLSVIDWELAIFGDPLHDLATHVVRMGYEEPQQRDMTRLWAAAMENAGYGALTAGLHEDLPVYVDFEYAQSVFPDVMRAALSLRADADQEHFQQAADRVRRAVVRASGPLGLAGVPCAVDVVEALREWHSTSVPSTERLAEGMPSYEQTDLVAG
ncbi:phosphotransferase [Streptomyces sp. NPDC050508]|uniref:phosphotransferase n=1 Tax=Streptomyces sp. NPDC050508 TaxID=3155405 RepID=UPI003436021C